MVNAIELQNVTKHYKNFSLNNISFSVPMGSIMGFVGENGAGKTTTMKAILDLIHIDSGEINVLGSKAKDIDNITKSKIGVVFDGNSLHDTMNMRNISYIMSNIYPNWDKNKFELYKKKFNLPVNKIIKEFSRGMKMKLSIAIALSHHAQLLILDEATSGLDPMIRDEVLDILLDFIQDEKNSVLLSSHIISDIEKIADYVTFIHEGNIVFSKGKDELIYDYGLVHCKKAEFKKIDSSYIEGIREHSYGVDCMVNNISDFKRRYKELHVERISIEDIMLFMSRGKGGR